jgi:hypothetical protein
MTLIGEMSFLERMQFFNGQRLFASDLQSLEADNRERRWLHNASLHQPGVGSGYAVTGNKGDREVTITAGYAIDSVGREIILTEKHVEPVPPVADDGFGKPVFYDLTVCYPDDDALEESELREGICSSRGVIRLREAPVFCWVRLNADGQPRDPNLKTQVAEGIKIRLARAEVFDCQLNNPISTAQRRNARPPRQPYIASGESHPDLKWKFITQTSSGIATVPGLEIEVDTTAAGFATTPCYSAQIIGERFFSKPVNSSREIEEIYKRIGEEQFLLDGFISIAEPNAQGFMLRTSMPLLRFSESLELNPDGFFTLPDPDSLTLLQANNWYVVWLGVEG